MEGLIGQLCFGGCRFSSSETTTFKKLSGATQEIDLETVSADGRTLTFGQDLDGNGGFDRVQTTVTDLSNNTTSEFKDLNGFGATTQKIAVGGLCKWPVQHCVSRCKR